jgi:hypothetical protein
MRTCVFSVMRAFRSASRGLVLVWALCAWTAAFVGAERVAEAAGPPRAVSDWLRKSAAPLPAEGPLTEPALATLRQLVGDAHVVGIGSATHGTAEFHQLTRALLDALVDRLDFRILALEAGFAECLALDAYVLNGTGSLPAILEQLGWVWATDEMQSVVEWIRPRPQPHGAGERLCPRLPAQGGPGRRDHHGARAGAARQRRRATGLSPAQRRRQGAHREGARRPDGALRSRA